MERLLAQYLADLRAIRDTQRSQPEQSYYPTLQRLLTDAANFLQHGDLQVVLQPQREHYGVPDFQVQQDQTIIGWCEAKPVASRLNHNTSQLRQYRAALHNLLLTNYLRFQLFINGELQADVTLADNVDTTVSDDGLREFEHLLNVFFAQSVPFIDSASQLADVLALRARFLRHAVEVEYHGHSEPLVALHNAYDEYLYPNISDDDFFDLIAQTIVYVLFAGWSQTRAGDFSLDTAAPHLPANVPLLENLFTLTINNPTLTHTTIGLHINNIVALLSRTNPQVLQVTPTADLQNDVGEDPVMYFYEPFLHAYSPLTAEARGVYYTPLAAVRAMVRLADSVVRERFSRVRLGLADREVFILDPATGTGTFLGQVARQIKENVATADDESMEPHYLHQRFLANTYGFEFLAAPYTIAHLKLLRILEEECGISLAADERLKIYLTNTLQQPEISRPALPFMEQLAAETRAASRVKSEQPLLVIIGNPPWSGHSENLNINLDGADIVEPFKWCDGEKVEQTKWINNDYVKFFRWVQWRITESSTQQPPHLGVIVFITDNSFIASPTFRGMRRFLLTQFNEICVVNLHGRSRAGAESERDQNIFAIQQGVCITVLVRNEAGEQIEMPTPDIFPTDKVLNELPFLNLTAPPEDVSTRENLRMQEMSSAPLRATLRYLSSGLGTRSEKYEWLNGLSWQAVSTAEQLRPEAPYYFFKPYDADDQYWTWLSVPQLFKPYSGSMCITTGNDRERVFLSKTELDAALSNRDESKKRQYNYRPFDERWIYHDSRYLERARMDVMQHLHEENVALIVLNQTRSVEPYNYAFVTSEIADKSLISTEANCYAYPYLRYPPRTDQQVLGDVGTDEPQPNISPAVLEQLRVVYGDQLQAEDIFYYTYAVLNASGYQQSYERELRIDFPHIPFTNLCTHFDELAALGRELAETHLKRKFAEITIGFHSAGRDVIETSHISHDVATNAIVINEAGTRFSGVGQEIWNYRVGTHQVLEQWLRARHGKQFVLDHSADVVDEVLIDDYRQIIRSIAAALPLHERINYAWDQLLEPQAELPQA